MTCYSLNLQGAKLVLFADDTNIFVADKDEDALQHKILSIMKQLQIWFQKNELIINTEKKNLQCNFILINLDFLSNHKLCPETL
jgi:hypothetical protein